MKKNHHPILLLLAALLFLALGASFVRGNAGSAADFSLFLPLLSKPEPPPAMFTSIGPDGGLIVALAINPQDDQIVYAGTWGAGVYKSSDGGQHWQAASEGLSDGFIQNLAIDPQNPATIYAGMYGYGVYKSTDGAATWQATGPGLTSQAVVYALVIDPTRPNILYAGTRDRAFSGPQWGGGVYRSENGGASWQAVNNGLAEDWVYSLAIHPQNPDFIYAILHTQGVNYSIDRGENWAPMNSGIFDLSTRDMVINPAQPDHRYVSTWYDSRLFKTLTGGLTWFLWEDGMYEARAYDLEIDPVDPAVVYIGTFYEGVKKTINAGDKWFDAGLKPNFVYRIKVSPQNHETLYAGTRGAGLFKSDNAGAGWYPSHAGISNAWVTSVIADTPEQAVISVMGDGIFTTSDAGNSWQRSTEGWYDLFVNFVMRSPHNPQVLYAGSENSGFYISLDGGNIWQKRNNGIDDLPHLATIPPLQALQPFTEDILRDSRGEQLTADETFPALSLAAHPSQPETLLAGMGSGLFFTDNNGVAWYVMDELYGRPISDVCYDPNNPLKILAGTAGGNSGSLLITVDGGKDWNPARTGLDYATVYTVVPDPFTADKFYVGASNGLYASVDGGFTWVLQGFGGQAVLTVERPAPDVLYAGTTTGLYRRIEAGAWENLSDGLPHDHLKILDLAFAPGSDAFFVATETHGVFYHAPAQP